jgi:hypothetical protein
MTPALDPLAYGVPLPLRACYCPMGIQVEIETNSAAVQSAAAQMWGRYPPVRGNSSVTFRIAVADRCASVPPRASTPLGQAHLVSMVHGPDNFAACDLRASFGFAWLTQDVANDSAYLRYHFLEPAVYLMINALHFSPVHASCVALNGRALVLCGDSGAGKTTLAYACAKRGWTYLSDDATHVVRDRSDRTVVGRPFSIRFRDTAQNIFPELNAWPVQRRPNGKLDLEIDTSELRIPIALESQACAVVFLNRRNRPGCGGVTPARVDPVPAIETLRQFSRVLCFGDDRMRAEQLHTLREFAELPAVELSYGDFANAEQVLRQLCAGT